SSGLLQCFDEKELTPHDGLVDAEIFVDVVDAAAQDSFPTVAVFPEVLRDQRFNSSESTIAIGDSSGGTLRMRRQLQQTNNRNRGSTGIDRSITRRIEIPRRHTIHSHMRQPVICIVLRNFQINRIARQLVTSSKSIKRPRQTTRPARITSIPLLRRLPQ